MEFSDDEKDAIDRMITRRLNRRDNAAILMILVTVIACALAYIFS